MAGEFLEATLGDLLAYANGRASPERADGLPYPVYGSNGIIGYASETNADQGTIVIGRVGSYCGSLYVAKQKCWVTDNAIRATALGDNDPRFLFYLLSMLGLNDWRAGSGQPLLNQDILSRIPTIAPTPTEQRAIGRILGALDDKIELNRRMSEMLEAMARALFKSWFVDFDPVRAKAEGRDPGLPKPIADLFPAHLVDSELGEIPEGWEVGRLESATELLRNQTNPCELPEQVFSHHSIPAFDNEQQPSAERGAAIKSMKFCVPVGTVLFSKLNPVIERVWLVDPQPDETAICSTEFLVFPPKVPFERCFLYCLLRSPDFRDAVNSLVTGTSNSHQRARADGILAIAVARPPARLAGRFERLVGPIFDRTLANRRESQTLAKARDSLLPKLISGEIRVRDAQVLGEAALAAAG